MYVAECTQVYPPASLCTDLDMIARPHDLSQTNMVEKERRFYPLFVILPKSNIDQQWTMKDKVRDSHG